MKDAAGKWIGLGPGDDDPEVAKIKQFLKRKFSYAATLDDTTLYTTELAVVVAEMQVRYGLPGTGIWGYATKVRSGYLRVENVKPMVFTVEGHMSDMFVGPCAFTAQALENEGRARWQPVGYNNTKMPFDNASGINELDRLFSDHNLFPPRTLWEFFIFSQGGIVGCEFYLKQVRPENGKHHDRLKDLRAVIAFGNPYRQQGVVAEWIPDPPSPRTGGISDVRMTDTPAYWREVVRKGDLYSENDASTNAGEHETAIYKAVQSQWTGTGSLLEQLLEIGVNPTMELVAVARAIIHGVRFVGNMGPHGTYDLGPCIDFARSRLT